MLRAPVLTMRDIRNKRFGRSVRRKSSKDEGVHRKDLKVSLRDAFYIQALSCCSRFKGTNGEESELYVTVQISERKEDCGEHGRRVFYKDDQDRFPHRYTLKLRTASKYIVNIAADPAQDLTYVKVGGVRYDEFRIINDPDSEEEDKVIFSFLWTTKKLEINGKMYRTVLPCVIKFEGYKEIKFEVMVKFYKREDKEKYCKGKPLTSLVLNYAMDDKQLKTKHPDIQFH